MGNSRYGSVDEVAALLAFVAAPEESYITGANLTVDGNPNWEAFATSLILYYRITCMEVAFVIRYRGCNATEPL